MGIFLIDMDNNFLVLFSFVLVIVGVLFRIEFFSVEGLIVKIYGQLGKMIIGYGEDFD